MGHDDDDRERRRSVGITRDELEHLLGHVVHRLDQRFDRFEVLLHRMIRKEIKVGVELEALRAQVEANTSVDQSAVALLNGIKAKLDAAIASGNPAEIQRLSDELGTSNAALAAAVSANTPVEP